LPEGNAVHRPRSGAPRRTRERKRRKSRREQPEKLLRWAKKKHDDRRRKTSFVAIGREALSLRGGGGKSNTFVAPAHCRFTGRWMTLGGEKRAWHLISRWGGEEKED